VTVKLLIEAGSSFPNEPFLGYQFSVTKTTKLLSSIFFLFRPLKAQNLLPKICIKSPISRLVRQIDRRCLGLIWGFRGWPIQWNHAKWNRAKCCGQGNKFWAFLKIDCIASSFFVSRWNRVISWPSVLRDKNYKTVFFDFWLRPPNAQNLTPNLHKIAS